MVLEVCRKNNMIVAEIKNKIIMYNFERFGEVMSDGRLTSPSDGKVYRLWEAILLSKQLDGLLSPEEMKRFEV